MTSIWTVVDLGVDGDRGGVVRKLDQFLVKSL